MAVECFTVLSEEVLTVLLDLPPELVIDRVETSELLQSDGTRRKVHLFHFRSERDQWRGEVDFVYHVSPVNGATSLHSIGYSSSNLEERGHAPQAEDTGRASR